ncbi:MAG: L-threonylcarbamoyladenylate synthase [bacterium]
MPEMNSGAKANARPEESVAEEKTAARARPRIGLILGSKSDLRVAEAAVKSLEFFGERVDFAIASAHRTPGRVAKWAVSAEARGLRVTIAVAGAAAALPGVVAAHTLLPVIGVPVSSTSLQGQDALFSIAQMPPGIPVACVGIDAGVNAALLAVHILASEDAELRSRLANYRKSFGGKLMLEEIESRRRLGLFEGPASQKPTIQPLRLRQMKLPAGEPREYRLTAEGSLEPLNMKEIEKIVAAEAGQIAHSQSRAVSETAAKEKSAEAASGQVSPKPRGRILPVDPENPDSEAMERAADLLLEGKIVAVPTDTVYGLAVDATNKAAVERLYNLKGRDPRKPLALLIHNLSLIRDLLGPFPSSLEENLESLWPGALTVVFRRRGKALLHIPPIETLGLRVPDHNVTLALISVLGRPLATTSANFSGQHPHLEAERIEKEFGDAVSLVLDAGPSPGGVVSTVIDVSSEPFRILREGFVTRDRLKEVFGERLV